MKISTFVLRAATLTCSAALSAMPAQAASDGWSVVPYIGLSALSDQSPQVFGADDIVNGDLDVAVDSGFTAGLGVRYDYEDSRWTSEFGWEYRSNDSSTTAANGVSLPDGNYASNTFYFNGRYALTEGRRFTPWLGGGLTWIQEIDLDSENSDGERSFSDSGSIGFQLMAGVDYDLTERLYLTGELRYSSLRSIDLSEEGGSGQVTDIDYQPATLGIGIGYRF
ncbi:MAG: outer membrane beta-barrel protein [Granulosicoccus sp.]|nr:outer membrane beta-barrel protein [Granulosicoccus sp.]